MKPHSSEVASRRYATTQSVAWLLEITDGDEAWRAASRALTFDGNEYPDAIAAQPDWEMRSRDDFGAGGVVGTGAAVRVADVIGGEGSLRAWIVARDPLGLAARLTLVWLDEPNAPAADDAVVMLEGVVTGVGLEPAAVSVSMCDRLSARLDLPACRVLTAAMIGDEDSPLIGSPLPLVFGAHANLQLSQLRSGPMTRLAAAISDTDDVIPLVSLAGFPDSGTAQIGGELITYTSLDTGAGTLGSAGDPVTRGGGGGATAHSSGARVRLVPDGGFQWLVADHECESVASVRADGAVLDGADWTAELRDIGGVDAQVVTMDQWPVVLGELANQITADVEGWPAPSTGALENPADIIELLLTEDRFAALPGAALDDTSLEAARDELDAAGFVFRRVIASRATLGELIESAARESALWIRAGGELITFTRAGATPHPADALETLDESRALKPDAAINLTPVESPRLHDRLELFSDSGELGFVRATGPLDSPPLAPLRRTLHWLAPDAADAWNDLGGRVWTRVSESHPRHEQSFPLGAALLDPGDVVLLTRAPLGLDRSPAWIERARLDGGSRVIIRAAGPETGEFCWTVNDETFLRHFGFGRRLVVVLAGRPIMSVTNRGGLLLRGALTESGLASPPTLPTPVHLIGDDLYFGAGSAGSYTAFARLDADGNMELRGTVEENSGFTFTAPDTCISSTGTRFYLSANARDPSFEYRPGTQILHLPGSLVENALL